MDRMTAPTPDASAESPIVDRVAEALSLPHPVKPRLRGWLHAGMFPAVLVSGLALTALAGSTRARAACAIFVLTACLLFGVSAIYHRGTWSPRMDGVLRRLDHANIFLIIAGSVRDIDWSDYTLSMPAFLAMVMMPFTYSITNGIGIGFIAFCVLRLAAGRGRSVPVAMYVVSAVFVFYYAMPALGLT